MCQYYRIFSQLVLASERDIILRRLESTLSQWHTCLSVSVCYTGAGARHRDHPSAPEPPLLSFELSRLNKWTHWHIPLAPDSQSLSLSSWFSPLVTPVPQATFSILQTDQSWQEAGGRHRGRDRAVSGVRVKTLRRITWVWARYSAHTRPNVGRGDVSSLSWQLSWVRVSEPESELTLSRRMTLARASSGQWKPDTLSLSRSHSAQAAQSLSGQSQSRSRLPAANIAVPGLSLQRTQHTA